MQDDTQVNVVALETGPPGTWQWRLYLPKGARYKWNIACEDIVFDTPANNPIQCVSNEPYWETSNEVLVTARLNQDENSDTCTLSVTSRIGDSKNQMAGTSLKFARNKLPTSSILSSILGSQGTVTVDPNGPIFLLQQRNLPDQNTTTQHNKSQPTTGYMIWLSKW